MESLQVKRCLEIGAGDNPQKGSSWIHQDIRPLSGIEMVCDAEKIPVKDEIFVEVFSSHVIEHFGWRKVRPVLVEWVRILEKGGRLEIITPDFYNLWKNLIDKRAFPGEKRFKDGVIDSAFVAYVTGGGQDYPENTHKAHYTYDWYEQTLKELGCDVEIRFHGRDAPSPSIRIIAIKK